jgi:hypothetical protein
MRDSLDLRDEKVVVTPTPTGRENACILYCVACDWERDDAGAACANICPKCETYGLRFVRYGRGTEEREARKVIARFRAGCGKSKL